MRARLAKGEKPLDWVGSSKRDFLAFPEPVKDEMGNALGLAQFGGKHPNAKPWKGEGPGVFEVVEDHRRRHLSGGLHGALPRGRLRAARVPEEIAERQSGRRAPMSS